MFIILTHALIIYLDKALLPLVSSSEYSAIVISDHAPHSLILNFTYIKGWANQWRFDSGLLSDKQFCEYISSNIDVFIETNKWSESESEVNVKVTWHTAKYGDPYSEFVLCN